MPTNISSQALSRYRGDSASLSISLTDPDTGSAFNPTGSVLIFTIKGTATDLDSAALVQKISSVGGITVASPCVVSLVPADHAALPARVTFEWDVQAQNTVSGAVKTVARGTLFFYDDVTKELTISIETIVVEPSSEYLNAEQLIAARDTAVAAAATATAQATIATTQAGLAATARTAAEAAQAAAAASAAAALASQSAAAASAAAAVVSAATATTQAGTATTQAGLAATARTAAEAAQAAALASQTAAAASAAAAASSAATATTQAAAAAASAALASSVVLVNVAPHLSGREGRGGIISTGASAVGTTQDNTGLAFGTGNLTVGMWLRLADWTPGSTAVLWGKTLGNTGIYIQIATTGIPEIRIGNGASFSIRSGGVATGLADGAWAFLAFAMDRSGNASAYVNGALLGAAFSISADSAISLTVAGPMLWAGALACTLGESWIISGLLTATQISDIYRAGSIAPFSASFTFFQWCDFGQGYGPIIKDRSGLNQPALMGTSGLSHAVPRNPPGVPQRAPRTGIVLDGTASSFIRNTLTNQSVGTGDFSLYSDHAANGAPSDASFAAVAGLSSSATSLVVARALGIRWTTASVQVVLFGATTSDTNTWTCTGLVTLLGTGRNILAMTRTGTTVKFFLGLAGDWLDITNLGVFGTSGSAPGWDGTITSTYALGGAGLSSAVFVGSIFDIRLANVAMTEAQLRTEYERGEPGDVWKWGTNVDRVVAGNALSNGSTDANNTIAVAGSGGGGMNQTSVAGARTGGAGGYFLRLQAVGAGALVYVASSVVAAGGGVLHRFRFSVWARRNAGAFVIFSIGRDASGNAANNIAITGSWAQYTGTAYFVPTFLASSLAGLTFLGFGAGSAASDEIELDDLQIYPLGYTARLRTDTAAGLTALDGSANKNDFLLSTTGVTTSPDGRTQTIRATTNTSGNQQLAGASVIDTTKRWRIRSWNINSSGTPTVSLGNVSAGAQYLSGSALTATNNEVTLLTRIPGTANLWCNANSTATLEHTVILDLVD